MKHTLILLLLATGLGVTAAPQESRPPLSKDEVMDLLGTSTPSKVIVSTLQQSGIAFEPTDKVLEQFRKAGADKAVLAALREAWHANVSNPLTDKEIRMMVAEDVASENIVQTLGERGIDFRPSDDYLEGLRADGAKDVLIDALRKAVPRPFTKDELLQRLDAGTDQDRAAQQVQQRGIEFEPDKETLQALRNAGAQPPLVEAIRNAKRLKPFVAQAPPAPKVSAPLVKGKPTTLICGPEDTEVPVFAVPNDLGNIAAHLRCGEHVTFLGTVESPPGVDRIGYGDGKEGFVSNSYLEQAIATVGTGVLPPRAIYKPDPGYTPEARHDRIEGSVEFWIVVSAQGNVTDVKETSPPLGGGLDQNAMDTVKTWKFQPATRDGVPVPVRVMAQISFRLYQNAP